jgi:RNA polymerase sigma factor (sigma-70 family)
VALRADDVDLDRDQGLVRRFQEGDDEAFDELYRRYHGRLERFCRKRVGDQHAAEEVTQEAFTRALQALPAMGGDLRFYPWVSVIASRLCIDYHRRQSRSEPAANPDPGWVSGGQEEIVDAVDASLAVIALARLAPRHQDVLQLREVEGWSYQHIADHYGVPLGTVETLLFRARRALRRQFHLVDGAGLAAVPLLGRVAQLAGRVRNRMPSWVPSAPSPTAVAAAAAATVAAVALAVVPGHVSVKPPAAPPAHQTTMRTPAPNATGSVVVVQSPSASPAVPESPSASMLVNAAGQVSAPPVALPSNNAPASLTTTSTVPSTSSAGANSPQTDPNGPGLPITTPLTLPSLALPPLQIPLPLPALGAIVAAVPALPVLPILPNTTIPALSAPIPAVTAATGAVVPAVQSTVDGLLGNLLPPANG